MSQIGVASVAHANSVGGSEGCGWITISANATTVTLGLVTPRWAQASFVVSARADLLSREPCRLANTAAASDAYFGASFYLPTAADTTIIISLPALPGGGTLLPTIPDQATPAIPGNCAGLPTYSFHNAASGGWFALPASGSAIRFDALDTTRFTGITGFPDGSTWVDVCGQSHGPFTSGQSFSFAHQPGGSVTTFNVRVDAGHIPALTGSSSPSQPTRPVSRRRSWDRPTCGSIASG